MPATATSCLDLLDERVLQNPYPVYEAMRHMGPAVYLERHGVWGIPRHEQVAAVLSATEVFRAEGQQLLTPLAGAVLPVDGARHMRLRQVLAHRLTPRAVARLRESLTERARRLVAEHGAGGTFDAVALAREMAVGTLLHLMDLPETTPVPALASGFADAGRATELPGPPAGEQAMVEALTAAVRRGRAKRGSWMETLLQAVAVARIDESEVIRLAVAYATAGIDSTVLGLAGTIVQLARHPKQWSVLRDEPARAEAAFHEAVRLDAPIQGIGRVVTEPVDLDGVRLEAGERVWLLIGSAGRDPRRWGLTTDDYDLRRPGADKHLALGAGTHECRYLALMQAHALLRALAAHCTTLALDGTPARAQTHTLRGFTAAPISVSTGIRRGAARRPKLTPPLETP
ncbi:cytochrome P450 [Streptomyces sp. NPDC020800]|uniref:cytochrome P450 n=1 Tax=Streptomyces sp. NPDC020800 TaxID=3365092 RepID=UPI0037924262